MFTDKQLNLLATAGAAAQPARFYASSDLRGGSVDDCLIPNEAFALDEGHAAQPHPSKVDKVGNANLSTQPHLQAFIMREHLL